MAAKSRNSASGADHFFDALESSQKEIASRLRQLLKTHFPNLSESINARGPVYALGENNLFSIEANATHVNLKFFKGASLLDPYYLLENAGKGVRYMIFYTQADLNEDYVRQLVAQSIDRELVRS
jgi:hypothetical protein